MLFAGDTFELSEEDLAWTGPRNRWEQLQLGPVVQHNQADSELGLIFFSISQPKNREFLLKTLVISYTCVDLHCKISWTFVLWLGWALKLLLKSCFEQHEPRWRIDCYLFFNFIYFCTLTRFLPFRTYKTIYRTYMYMGHISWYTVYIIHCYFLQPASTI